MKEGTIDRTLAHTTIDLDALKLYVRSDPGYLISEIEAGNSEYDQTVANYADFFEFWLRRYVASQSKTLHRLFIEVRAFMAFDEEQAGLLIPLLMGVVEETLLQNEWYELVPRLEAARHRVKRRFGM